MKNKLQILLWVVILFVGIMLAWTLRLEASETRYLTEEVCEVPTGCPFVKGKCIGCVTKTLAPLPDTINNYTTNNYNKTEVHNHNYTKEILKETIREVVEVPVTTELKVVHEMVTISEPVERLRPYISVNDNDKISILGARHLGNNVWTFKMKARGKSSKCTSSRITTNFTGGGASCNNEFFHYSVDWE
jgi:hypothetical protein|tara:strand:+ start:91 stop:657 length:567 start_codon:yes stop_codon:yes gene_type:complete